MFKYGRNKPTFKMRAVCEYCFQMSLVFDEFPLEFDCEHEDEEKVKKWIENHKKTCDGKITILKGDENE
jgi:hypothetical protein